MSSDIDDYGSVQIETEIGETARGDPVVAHEGCGSRSGLQDLIDRTAPSYRRERKGQTHFWAENVSDHRKWRRLKRLDNGHDRVTGPAQARRFRVGICEGFASAIGVPEHIKQDAMRMVADADGRGYQNMGGLEGLALGAIAFTQNRWITDWDDRIQTTHAFNRMAEKHDINVMRATSSVKKQVA